jgi:carboxypeptidase family protein/TonB-dependent receptor-like protein
MTRSMRTFAAILTVLLFAGSMFAQQASSTAQLSGEVKDQKGAVIQNATVTARDDSRGIDKSTTTDASGQFQILQLPPGSYTISVSAPTFGKSVAKGVVLTVGQAAVLPTITLKAMSNETVEVTAQAELVETQRTSSASTIQQQRIENLPINGRNYIQFTLTDSQNKRDDAPSIGAAPTSGLNFGGQRARANLVNVDGVDAVDNSVNGIRSTVSQEAVQEFQIINGSFNPEYGRASGGVVNIVTKGGSNDIHGDIFGFWRDKSFQAKNPFTTTQDPQYTRVQYGATLGGAIKKDRTFYFLSFEGTRRQETGFSSIGRDNFGFQSLDLSTLGACNLVLPPGAVPNAQLTPDQVAFFNALPANGPDCGAAATYANLSSHALTGSQLLLPPFGFFGTQTFPFTGAPNPGSLSPLNSLVGNFPVSEATDLYSGRLDHKINNNQQLMFRFGISPSRVTGIEVNGQNQVFGQNSFSRTSKQVYKDWNLNVGHTWTIGSTRINEFRFQYAHRRLSFDPSAGPGGQNVAVNIPGFAFFGREPFSFVHRTEDRYQWADNFTWVHGNHTMKFGVDINHLPLSADFTVNFGGLYNFGGLSASSLGAPSTFPAISPIQAYGAGIPQVFVQGIGNPHDSFSNNTLGLFWQDSWKARQNLTFNYGLRYDAEYTPEFPAVNAVSAKAQEQLGITQGIPRDLNNIAPRIGMAWDPWSDGKTVVRASYGIFYDHPLLALAFDSDVADGSQAPQLAFFGAAPSACSPTGSNLNATNLFQGIFDGSCYPGGAGQFGYLPNEQRFDAFLPGSVFTQQNYLTNGVPIFVQPFGFPTAKDFQYAYSHQVNVTFEHDLGHNFLASLQYNLNLGRKLNRPINANPVNTEAFLTNWENAVAAEKGFFGVAPDSSPYAVGTGAVPCFPGGGPFAPFLPASLVSFFRPGGINPSLAPLFGACNLIANAAGISNNSIPFSDMIANYSNGESEYQGLTANLRKRFSNHYEFLTSYTWSHSIDDSTDLQSLLAPQDSRFPDFERSRSTFDQRHRLVFSAVYQSGTVGSRGSARHILLSDWTVAPIIEVSSGRPFNVLVGSDTNFDLSSNTDRPLIAPGLVSDNCGNTSVQASFSPTGWIIPACGIDNDLAAALAFPADPTKLPDGVLHTPAVGNLGRNAGTRPYTVFNDIRVSRRINLGERFKLDGTVDMFNIVNRFNVADVNVIWDHAGQPTAAFDPRQFQFGLKLSW